MFIGGNSKNGPEYFFRKHIKEYNIKLELVSKETPKIQEFVMPNKLLEVNSKQRIIKTVSLTSSSGAANISIGSNPFYKQLKASNPKFNAFDFRILQYQEYL